MSRKRGINPVPESTIELDFCVYTCRFMRIASHFCAWHSSARMNALCESFSPCSALATQFQCLLKIFIPTELLNLGLHLNKNFKQTLNFIGMLSDAK